jgi:uncharacterized delta-60 repeat protein
VAIQTDGKIVVVGETSRLLPRENSLAVARYMTTGSLDRSFGNKGKVTAKTGLFTTGAVAISEGKIIVGGYTGEPMDGNTGPGDFAVARFSNTGLLDRSFGHMGEGTADFGSGDAGSALAVQPDGKIVVAGTAGVFDHGYFGLARFTPDGSLDRSFGTTGKVTTDLGSFVYGNDVAIQPDGKIVVVGGTEVGEEEGDFALARYAADGALDPGFGATEASPSPSLSAAAPPRPGPSRHSGSWQRVVVYSVGIGLPVLILVSLFFARVVRRRRAST